MSKELIIALAASVTSLIVAVISLISTVINNRHATNSTKELEILKKELARQTIRDNLQDSQLSNSIQSLKDAIQAIQMLKDELQLILQATESSLDTPSAVDYIRSARNNLFKCFESNLGNLGQLESKVFHKSKAIAIEIETIIVNGLKYHENASLLSTEDRKSLVEHRLALTEVQQMLRDCRDNLFCEMFTNAT